MTQIYFVRRGTVAASASELDAALRRMRSLEEQPSAALDARWLHSYALREADGRFGLACVFRADAADTLRRHAMLAALPVRDIVAVQATRMLRPFAPTKVYLVRRQGVGRDAAQFEQRLGTARRIADEDMPRQVSWLHSYALQEDGGVLGTVCLYQAVDPGALREHASRAGLPVDEITPVFGRLVFRDDPAPSRPDQAMSA
ncbi:nickel-binding protein [uncultured Piscinibacter sp.]|uniref:nickel-binding protein n=1 Tax=uncultured Piscinibacter sp. TaxID=1131835 RepID=UPI002607EE53|nr:nickel-binding protein [uncultured Piscinibacter sp.]